MESSSGTEEDDESLQLEDDGEYEVVVHKDPYARPMFPPPLPVPPHIARPAYALPGFYGSKPFLEAFGRDGRIVLGSEDEMKLRRAARLARRVLTYAGSLVSVCMTATNMPLPTDCCSQV